MKFLSFCAGQYLAFSFCLLLVLAICGCSKEPLDIRDIPFKELESSYYQLDERSIEIPYQEQTSLLIDKDETSIRFTSSEIFNDIQAGDMIVSSMDTPSSEFICRKVVEKNDQGTRVEFITERASLVEAYDSFYFNSEKSNLVQIREESFDVAALFNDLSSPINTGLNELWSSVGGVGEVVFQPGLVGEMALEAIHPNDFYLETCGCFPTANDYLDDNNNNIINGAEEYLKINESNIEDVMELGFFTAKINNFGINNMSLNVTTGDIGISASDLDENFNAFSTASVLAAIEEGSLPSLSPVNDLNLYHVPTPITVGAASVFFSAGPLIEASGSVAGYIGATMSSPSRIDIQLGHVDLYTFLNSEIILPSDFNPAEILVPDVVVTSGGNPASGSSIFNDLAVHGHIGAKGNATIRLGVNVGMSAGGGEATTNGFAIGFMAPVGLEVDLCGTGTASMQFYPYDLSSASFNGLVCGDIRAGIFDVSTFSDVNISGTTIDNYLDLQIALSDLVTGIPDLSFSVLQGAEGFSSSNGDCGSGICFKVTSCDNISLETFNLGLDANDNLQLEFFITNPNQIDDLVLIFKKSDGTEVQVPGTYSTGTHYKNIPWITNQIEVVASAIVSEGDFIVKSASLLCEKGFSASEVNVSSHSCALPFSNASSNTETTHSYTNPAGQSIMYYKYSEQATYPTLGELTTLVGNVSTCTNTTGFFIKDASGMNHGNASKNYAFVNVNGVNQLMSYEILFNASNQTFYLEQETETFSPDVYAPKLQ